MESQFVLRTGNLVWFDKKVGTFADGVATLTFRKVDYSFTVTQANLEAAMADLGNPHDLLVRHCAAYRKFTDTQITADLKHHARSVGLL